jgi:hypothetical protein
VVIRPGGATGLALYGRKLVHATTHPVMASLETSETWGWCYVDERGFDLGYGARALPS